MDEELGFVKENFSANQSWQVMMIVLTAWLIIIHLFHDLNYVL